MTPTPNPQTFETNKQLLASPLVASDDDVRDAMLFAYENFKIVVEPGAAVGIAAVLNGQIDIKNKTIVAIVTGRNISPDKFCELLKPANRNKGRPK